MVLPLNFSRRMDASGRYVIPAQIRKEFGVNSNELLSLCLINQNGEYYLGFKVSPSEEYIANLKKFCSVL